MDPMENAGYQEKGQQQTPPSTLSLQMRFQQQTSSSSFHLDDLSINFNPPTLLSSDGGRNSSSSAELNSQREEDSTEALMMEDNNTVSSHRHNCVCDAGFCSKVVGGLLLVLPCSVCKCRVYCSEECQLEAAMAHANECPLLKACKESPNPAKRHPIQNEIFSTLLCVETVEHGTHVVLMEKYQYAGDESNRSVPLASVLCSNERPTSDEVLRCLIQGSMYPEFDTICSGRRRPNKILLMAPTFGSTEEEQRAVLDDVTTVATRLRCSVELKRSLMDHHQQWDADWFCVQKEWNDELRNATFLGLIPETRRKPVPPNGCARRSAVVKIEKMNQLARQHPPSPEDAVTRQEALHYPYCDQTKMVVVALQGVLYICIDEGEILVYYRRVVLDTVNGRPAEVQDVLHAIYKACVLLKKRPHDIMIGQPSICDLRGVRVYEKALDKSIAKGHCHLAQHGTTERIVASDIRRWRREGILKL